MQCHRNATSAAEMRVCVHSNEASAKQATAWLKTWTDGGKMHAPLWKTVPGGQKTIKYYVCAAHLLCTVKVCVRQSGGAWGVERAWRAFELVCAEREASAAADTAADRGGLAFGFASGLAGWAAWSWDRGTSSSLLESDMAVRARQRGGQIENKGCCASRDPFFFTQCACQRSVRLRNGVRERLRRRMGSKNAAASAKFNYHTGFSVCGFRGWQYHRLLSG